MKASLQEYEQAKSLPRPPRFSTWVNEYLGKEASKSEYYSFATDLVDYIPPRIADRKAFDREAVRFITEYPNMAFRRMQEIGFELTTPDLVNLVKKNIFGFLPALTREQKLQYQGAEVRLSRVVISLNREKLNKRRFIELSQLHNLTKLAYDKNGIPESALFSDYMYAKFMKEVLSDYYDIEGRTPKELWPHWLEFLKSLPIE